MKLFVYSFSAEDGKLFYFMSTESAFGKIHEMFNANNTKRTEGFDMVNKN
jgi:hypothetical protein